MIFSINSYFRCIALMHNAAVFSKGHYCRNAYASTKKTYSFIISDRYEINVSYWLAVITSDISALLSALSLQL